VLALTAAGTSSAWNAGGSILTFYFPIGLFVVIGVLLCLQFGRPHAVPGRKPLALAPSRDAVSAGAEQVLPGRDTGEPGASKADG
jgi:hypothetical protein